MANLSPPVEGVLWMAVATVCWTANTLVIRPISAELPAIEMVFWRCFLSSILVLPFLWRIGFGAMRTARFGLLTARGALMLVSMLLWIRAVNALPMADAVALSFTAPLFATVLAAAILRETVRARRWSAVAIGFVGALVIVRPGLGVFDPSAFYALGNAASWAGAIILIRILARTESPTVIVAYMFIMLTPLSLVPSLFVWVTPSLTTFLLLASLAATGLLGHLAATRAFSVAETSIVAPVEYLQLPLVGVSGYLMFAEVPHPAMPIGAAIIVGSVVYISHREAARARAAAKPPPLPPAPSP